jgi:hypothetical protein
MNFYRNRLALGAIPQIPRGGILGPDALANLELWFDATTIVGVSNGDAVPQWDDLSGNARHATEATNRPTYAASGINSLAAIKFGAGGPTKLTIPSFAITNYSLFISCRINQFAAYYPITFQQNDVNTGIVIAQNSSTRQITYRNYANSNNYDIAGSLLDVEINYVLGMTHGTKIYSYLNGVADGDGGGAATEVTKAFTIGNQQGSDNQFDGWIGEIVLYSRVLTASELSATHTYFINKWT